MTYHRVKLDHCERGEWSIQLEDPTSPPKKGCFNFFLELRHQSSSLPLLYSSSNTFFFFFLGPNPRNTRFPFPLINNNRSGMMNDVEKSPFQRISRVKLDHCGRASVHALQGWSSNLTPRISCTFCAFSTSFILPLLLLLLLHHTSLFEGRWRFPFLVHTYIHTLHASLHHHHHHHDLLKG